MKNTYFGRSRKTAADSLSRDKKANKVGGLFVASCLSVHNFQKQHAEHKETLLSVLKAAPQKRDNLFDVLMGTVKVTSLGNIRHSLYQFSGEYRCNV